MEYVDLGDHGWVHPEIEGILFGSRESAESDARRDNLDPCKVYEKDTRPMIREVAKQLNEAEEHVWDEGGISSFPTVRDEKWPEGRIKVFVVTGGSEGLYLHVEVEVRRPYKESEQVFVVIAKTLDSSTDKWYECWMSAARIARMLGA